MMNRIISKEDIPIDELDHIRAIRTNRGFNMSDEELKNFYVEWNNACYKLKHIPNNKRR